jgi:UDP-glucuronate decarboxylase
MHPNDGRVVSNFIVQALGDEPITLYGDGNQSRSFCYVDDLIEAFVRFMDSPDELTGPINLGNPSEMTIRELAETVIDITGSRSSLMYLPLPSDDPKQRRPDISLARKSLNWEPGTPLRDGLAGRSRISGNCWARNNRDIRTSSAMMVSIDREQHCRNDPRI